MCANFVAVVLLSWMPKFRYDRFHMGLATAGLTATLFVQLASMAGAPVGGWLATLGLLAFVPIPPASQSRFGTADRARP